MSALTCRHFDALEAELGDGLGELVIRQADEVLREEAEFRGFRRRRGFGTNPWASGSCFLVSHRLLADEIAPHAGHAPRNLLAFIGTGQRAIKRAGKIPVRFALDDQPVDHVDHAADRAVAVQQRRRATHHLNALGKRRLQKSINFGRLATEQEVAGDPHDKRHTTYLSLLNKIRRWWQEQIERTPVDEWDEERRQALTEDFEFVKDIYAAL